MTLRTQLWLAVLVITLTAMFAAVLGQAYATSLALAGALLFSLAQWRKSLAFTHAQIESIDEWLIALEGKDAFNPDAKPVYFWQGFATTLFAALRVKNHPTLSGKTLFVFRDEIDEAVWRTLVIRIHHGAHAVQIVKARTFL